MKTPYIDKLFLELSQVTEVKTRRERELEKTVQNLLLVISEARNHLNPAEPCVGMAAYVLTRALKKHDYPLGGGGGRR